MIKGAGRDYSGDYSPQAIEKANTALFSDLPVRVWQDHAADRQTIWYAPAVGSAKSITDRLIERGHTAAVIHANTPTDQRGQRIQDFRNGDLQHLVNVAVLAEGFDVPDADCVVVLRTTRSKVLYLQMAGRALRPQAGEACVDPRSGPLVGRAGGGPPAGRSRLNAGT